MEVIDIYTLKTESSFDSAHFLADYEGKCRNIHGHRWRIIIEIEGEKLISEGHERGMLVDFGELKKALRDETEALDHALIYELGSLRQNTIDALISEGMKLISFENRPTAENLSKYFYDRMTEKGYSVCMVTVYETPDNSAAYFREKNKNG